MEELKKKLKVEKKKKETTFMPEWTANYDYLDLLIFLESTVHMILQETNSYCCKK